MASVGVAEAQVWGVLAGPRAGGKVRAVVPVALALAAVARGASPADAKARATGQAWRGLAGHPVGATARAAVSAGRAPVVPARGESPAGATGRVEPAWAEHPVAATVRAVVRAGLVLAEQGRDGPLVGVAEPAWTAAAGPDVLPVGARRPVARALAWAAEYRPAWPEEALAEAVAVVEGASI